MNGSVMTAQDKKSTTWIEMIENLERLVFYASLLVLPISIIPLPWDLTEFSMGLSLIFFASILLTIELIKLVWKGRLLVPKASIDMGLLLVLLSILLSTAFSVSLPTSLWGFDFRLGSGFILTLVSFVYLYSARSFLFNYEEVLTGAKFLIVGTFLTALFSIFSFFGMNILSFSSTFDTLFTTGLPIYSSSRISVVIWGVSLLFSVFFSAISFQGKKLPYAFFALLSSIIHLIAIALFTLAQGWQLYALLTVVVVGSAIFLGVKSKVKYPKAFNIILYTFAGVALAVFILAQIPLIRNSVGGASQSLITQITITGDTSLKIVTQALSQNVLRSLVGMGNDTFSISFNQFRPLNDQTIVINATNFTNANTHLFNTLTNKGLLGFAAWVVLGYFLFVYVINNFKNNKFEKEQDLVMFVFDILSVFVFLTSIFIYHTFLITFLLVYLISMSVSIKNMIFKEKLEVYVINWGLFTHTSGNISVKNIAFGISGAFIILGVLLNIYAFRLGLSAYNALQAEKITAVAREKENLGDADKAQILVEASNYYATAIRYNNSNDVLHRRGSLIVSQYLESLASQYNKTDDESGKKTLFDQIATYVEISVEESKKATEIAPKVYANWAARSSVYSKLVGLGLTSYTKSALSALQNSANLNPLNYEVYYNAAQLYVLNNESDTALRTLNQLFSINQKHIPSLILAGEISSKDKDFKQAVRYFGDAKKVMEETNSTANDVYDYVNKRLKELDTENPATPVKETPKDTVPTQQEDNTQVETNTEDDQV